VLNDGAYPRYPSIARPLLVSQRLVFAAALVDVERDAGRFGLIE